MSATSAPVVVIGAGMGGLSSALDLAAGGIDVIVLERAAEPGGKLHETAVNSLRMDSGPTVFTMRWVFEDLFAAAGLDFATCVPLAPAELLARHSWPDGSRLDLFADLDRSTEAIDRFAGGDEAMAYRRFAARSAEVFATLDETFMRRAKPGPVSLTMSLGLRGLPRLYKTRPFVSLWRELGQQFRDQRLRQLFARYATYCGSSPLHAPATLMLIVHAERAGVWLVEGGMQRLAEVMAKAAADAGASIHYDSDVSEVRRSGDGYRVLTQGGESFEASAVVYNGDVAAFGQGLLGADLQGACPDRSHEQRSLSAITWCMQAEVRDFPLAHHTVFFGDDYPAEFRAVFDAGDISAQPTVYVCAQDRGHMGAAGNAVEPKHQESERLFLLINAPAKALAPAAIERAETAAFSLLERQGLVLNPNAASVVRATPADFERRFPGSAGAIYGWPTHGWFGSFRRGGATTRLPGLFCAGGTVHPGPGIPMATLSGRIAAAAVREHLGA